MTVLLVPLHQCGGMPSEVVGGKAAGLGRMLDAGLPVPPGACLTTTALELTTRTDGVAETYDRAAEAMTSRPAYRSAAMSKLRHALLTSELPQLVVTAIVNAATPLLRTGTVAVRSSAVAEDGAGSAYAGVFSSFIGLTTMDEVVDAVRRCWASRYTGRALSHHFGHLDTGMAVVIQQVVAGHASGVMFTADPLDAAFSGVVVEAAKESHDAVTSGQRANLRARISSSSDHFAGMPKGAAAHFLTTANRLTELFAGPVDAEWTWADNELILLQARPITALAHHEAGWHFQEDIDGVARLPLGRCANIFARNLQKKVWFRKACADADVAVYGLVYLTFPADDPAPLAGEVLAQLSAEILQVNMGDGAAAVRRADLAAHLAARAHTNLVGGGLATAQVGEVTLADTTGFSTLLADGSIWIEAFPAALSGIKAGARRPTTYRLSTQDTVLDQDIATTTELARYDMVGLRWRTAEVNEQPVALTPSLLSQIAHYTRRLSAALGEARLEWYGVADRLVGKDVSLETAPLDRSGQTVSLSAGAAAGPVVHVTDIAALDAYAADAGISVFAHGDEPDAGPLPLAIRNRSEPPIVIADYPSIGFIPAIPHVAGFIFRYGTLLSHTAIVLREARKPAIVDEHAANTLRDGERVAIGPGGVLRTPAKELS